MDDKLAEIEKRIRATICPTLRMLDDGPHETLEGRISQADYDTIFTALRPPATGLDATQHEEEIRAHVGWLKIYVGSMNEDNWRDMRLYLERQVQRLSEALARPASPASRDEIDVLGEAERGRLADLVKSMADEQEPGHTKLLLSIAAKVVRRGRHLTDEERLGNLARIFVEDGAALTRTGPEEGNV